MDKSKQKTRRASMGRVEDRQRLDVLRREQLPRMRAAAEKWRNGTALSSVVLAVFAAAGGPKRFDLLTDGARGWLALTLGVLAVAVVIALTTAMRASFGWPVRIDALKEGALMTWELSEIQTAYTCLRASLVAAAIGVVALFATTGLLLFAPQVPPH